MTLHDAISERVAIQCRTQCEAERLLSLAMQSGLKWGSGESYTNTKWSDYRENTIYILHMGSYGSINLQRFRVIQSVNIK